MLSSLLKSMKIFYIFSAGYATDFLEEQISAALELLGKNKLILF